MSFWALKRQPGLETAESQDKNIQFSNMYIWGCGRKCGWFDIYCQKKLLKCVLLSERKERSHPWWRLSSFSCLLETYGQTHLDSDSSSWLALSFLKNIKLSPQFTLIKAQWALLLISLGNLGEIIWKFTEINWDCVKVDGH